MSQSQNTRSYGQCAGGLSGDGVTPRPTPITQGECEELGFERIKEPGVAPLRRKWSIRRSSGAITSTAHTKEARTANNP